MNLLSKNNLHAAKYAPFVAVLLFTICAVVIAYQTSTITNIPIGTRFDEPFLHSGFYDPEITQNTQQKFRWTGNQAEIHLSGLGSGSTIATFTLAASTSSDTSALTTLTLKDHLQVQFDGITEVRSIHTFIPRSPTFDGHLKISLTSPTIQETTSSQRELGTALFNIQVATTQSQPLLPPLLPLILLLTMLFAVIVTLRIIGVSLWAAVGFAACVVVWQAWNLATHRSIGVLYLERLTILAFFSILITVLFQRTLPWLMTKSDVQLSSRASSILAGIVLLTFWIKASGVLHPYMVAIDVKWHMDKVRWIFDGRIGDLYGGKLNELVMPVEWGQEKPIIPYSPFFHLFAVWFRLLPWPMELTASIFSIFIDSTYFYIIYFITCKVGGSERAGLSGAAIYAITPSTYLLHSWGNVPTTFGIWWTLVAIAWLVGGWEQLPANRHTWWWFVIALTGAFLFYTVMAVFIGMFFVVLLGALFMVHEHRRRARSVVAAMGTALLIVTGLFYWQYIIPIIRQTIPLIGGRVAQGGENLGEVARPFSAYVREQAYLWDIYGIYIPLFFGIIGWWLLMRQHGRRSMPTLVFVAWIVVAVLWWFAGYKVDTVDKQLFWLLPAMAVGGGIAIDRVFHSRWRSYALPIVGLCFLYLASDSLYFWLYRIENVQGFTSLTQEALRWLGVSVRGSFS